MTAQPGANSGLAVALVVDADTAWCQRLVAWLTNAGCAAIAAADGAAARTHLGLDVDLVLWQPPAASADESWLDALRHRHPDVALVSMTTAADVQHSLEALRLGRVDSLVKPFGERRFQFALRRVRKWRSRRAATLSDRASREATLHRQQADLVRVLTADPIVSRTELDLVLRRLTASDPDLLAHGERVACLVSRLAERTGVSRTAGDLLVRAALAHDLPRLVLARYIDHPHGLRTEEHDVIRTAPRIGGRLFEQVPYLRDSAVIIATRHERWDGLGYPDGLQGEAIPLESRILALADTLDTLQQSRPYRCALGLDEAVAEIRRGRASQFDPALVDLIESFDIARTFVSPAV